MINFDALPKENPFGLIDKGLYHAFIESAEMKIGKTSGNPYLNVKYVLTDAAGTSKGVMFDMITESDSSVVQFKVGRFISAIGIPLVGAMELKDIGKLAVGKTIVIDVTHQKDTRDETQLRAVPDVFGHGIYYGAGEYESALVECGYAAAPAQDAAADFTADMPTTEEDGERPFVPTPANVPVPEPTNVPNPNTPADNAEY